MTPATWPREDPLQERLLHLDPAACAFRDARVGELPDLLRPGDLLVVNDAATLPASLPAIGPRGERLEVRLAAQDGGGEWGAVLFGEGDWRMGTEDRPPPPVLSPGAGLAFAGVLRARVVAVAEESPRLVRLRFDQEGDELWPALYAAGRPVQYSYMAGPVSLAHVQTAYASRPWAVEPPSAGRPLRIALLQRLRRRGVAVARLTHAAGLSATGDPAFDDRLPLAERFDIPADTVDAVARARRSGGRVVAAGTTVVRALEGSAHRHGGLEPGRGTTDVRIDGGWRTRVTDGLLTGLHEPGTSHFRLLAAFAPEELLERAWRHAEEEGYLAHEFGDSSLILQA